MKKVHTRNVWRPSSAVGKSSFEASRDLQIFLKIVANGAAVGGPSEAERSLPFRFLSSRDEGGYG